MRYRTMGTTGTSVSVFGLGTMVLGAWGNPDVDECVGVVHQALDAGVNLIDTADVYAAGETEEIVGRALIGRRDEVVLATKFWNPMSERPNERGASRRWIVRACDASLRRLRTDHIDLYQMHRPDPDVGFDELVDALDHLVRSGKVLHVGTSTWPAELIVEAQWAAARRGTARFATEQPPYSVFVRHPEQAVLPTCARHGLGVLVWAPLNGGWLTGKYRRGEPAPAGSRGDYAAEHMAASSDAKYDAIARLAAVAADAGLPLAHLALGWALEHPAVTSVLLGPKTPAQLADLLPAADVRVDRDILDAIDAIVAPGTTLTPTDTGWEPWWLQARHRRRPVER
jgi:aryl-alcohol dehydrogenase (NADP+)